MKSAAFLVDTGPAAGLGHLRRSCVLRDAMAGSGFDCHLYCADTDAAAEAGRAALPMPVSPDVLPKSDVAIVDSYRLDRPFIAELRRRCRVLLAFDDTAEHPPPDADIVLNHNIYGGRLDYASRTRGLILTGPDCTLVDRRIVAAGKAYRRSPGAEDVVVSFGGTDDGARGADVARVLLPRAQSHIHLVIAPGAKPASTALALADAEPRRVTLRYSPDMADLLARARIYVGGAGMTALEALVVGLDLVLVVLAPNQRLNAEAMALSGEAVIAVDDPASIGEAVIGLLTKPPPPRVGPVDGLGASRVVAAIERLLGS